MDVRPNALQAVTASSSSYVMSYVEGSGLQVGTAALPGATWKTNVDVSSNALYQMGKSIANEVATSVPVAEAVPNGPLATIDNDLQNKATCSALRRFQQANLLGLRLVGLSRLRCRRPVMC